MKTFQLFNLSTFLTLLLLTGCGFKASSSSGDPNGGLRAEAWTPSATPLDTGAVFDVTPQIAVQPNGGGTAIAVWIKRVDLDPADSFPAVYHLLATRCVDDRVTVDAGTRCGDTPNEWSAFVPATDSGCPFGNPDATGNDGICVIDTGSAQYDAWSPKVSMDNNGNAIVVWQQHDGTAMRVYARTFCGSCASPSWAAVKQLNDSADFGTFDAADPAIAVQADSTVTTVDSADATTGWSVGGAATSVSLNTTTFIEGTGAVNLIKASTASTDAYFHKVIASLDITGRQLQVSLYIRDAAALAKVADVQIYVFSGGAPNTCPPCAWKTVLPAQLSVGWNLLTFDPSSPSGSNGINYADITRIRMDVDTVTSATTYAAGEFIMDYWLITPGQSAAMAVWTQYYTINWQASYDTGNSVDIEIPAMIAFNGSLFASLRRVAGAVYVGDILMFDGTSWTTVVSGMPDVITSFYIYQNRLYAGQGYNGSGDILVSDDGITWTTSYDGPAGSFPSFAEFNGYLYAAHSGFAAGDGDVYVCQPATTGAVDVCEPGDWSLSFDSGLTSQNSSSANSLAVYNGRLYAGTTGNITTGGVLWSCDGTSNPCVQGDWTAGYTGVAFSVLGPLAVFNGRLYMATNVGGSTIRVCNPGVDTRCDAGDWSTSYTPPGFDRIFSLQVYNGTLYAGIGDPGAPNSGAVVVCNSGATGNPTQCDPGDWATSGSFPDFDRQTSSLAVFDGGLYAGMGASSSGGGAGDVYRFLTGWQVMARRCADGGDAGAACGDTASEWATSDTGVCPAGSGLNDGICFISAGTASQPAALPKVAMDDSGRAIAAFVKMVVQADCVESNPPPGGTAASINCTDSTLQANLFNGTSWQSAIDLDPGLSSVAASNQLICFEASGGVRGQSGSTDACVNVIEFDLAVNPAGQAALLIKTAWKENEDWNDTGTCAAGQHAGRCVPDGFAFEDYMGEAIVARQYTMGAAWATVSWTLDRLANFGYANGTHFGIGPFAAGCPSRMIMDGLRVTLNCHFATPQIALAQTGTTAIAVYESYDGTSYDIQAHRYDGATWGAFTTIDAGAGEAHAPQIAMDNSGFGVAVWTQSDGAIFRVNSNCFAPSTGVITTCGNVVATGWQGWANIDSGVGFESGYFNPVVGLSGPGGANSALSLFLGWSVLDNTTRLYYATGP